jgi:hypothetical protein
VLAALEAGEIEAGRHRAYLSLLEELSSPARSSRPPRRR